MQLQRQPCRRAGLLLWEKRQARRPARLSCIWLPPGDGVKQLMWRLQHGELPSETQHHPKVVVVHVGTNGESTCCTNPFLQILNTFCMKPDRRLCGPVCHLAVNAHPCLHARRSARSPAASCMQWPVMRKHAEHFYRLGMQTLRGSAM